MFKKTLVLLLNILYILTVVVHCVCVYIYIHTHTHTHIIILLLMVVVLFLVMCLILPSLNGGKGEFSDSGQREYNKLILIMYTVCVFKLFFFLPFFLCSVQLQQFED